MYDVDYYYAEHYPQPAFCFTPDAEFPVCNGEKGGFNGEIVSPPLPGRGDRRLHRRRGGQRGARPGPLHPAGGGRQTDPSPTA